MPCDDQPRGDGLGEVWVPVVGAVGGPRASELTRCKGPLVIKPGPGGVGAVDLGAVERIGEPVT
jgi:hypothetical protein